MVTDRYQRLRHHDTTGRAARVRRRCRTRGGRRRQRARRRAPREHAAAARLPADLRPGGPRHHRRGAKAGAVATVSIAQFGSTRSINAAVAAGIAMHAWITQHADLNGPGRAGSTQPGERSDGKTSVRSWSRISDDALVLHCARRAGLTPEAGDHLLVGEVGVRQDLHGHPPAGELVLALPHLPHAALAEHARELVLSEQDLARAIHRRAPCRSLPSRVPQTGASAQKQRSACSRACPAPGRAAYQLTESTSAASPRACAADRLTSAAGASTRSWPRKRPANRAVSSTRRRSPPAARAARGPRAGRAGRPRLRARCSATAPARRRPSSSGVSSAGSAAQKRLEPAARQLFAELDHRAQLAATELAIRHVAACALTSAAARHRCAARALPAAGSSCSTSGSSASSVLQPLGPSRAYKLSTISSTANSSSRPCSACGGVDARARRPRRGA